MKLFNLRTILILIQVAVFVGLAVVSEFNPVVLAIVVPFTLYSVMFGSKDIAQAVHDFP